jgi:UTP--glucose-1-phosphate uridylyltransferase
MKIKKAVIPVAGLGTRFLPYTKSIPKEMLPIMDLPVIHFIVEEAIKAGIREIIFVTSKDKKSIEDYFTRNRTLEALLKKKKKTDCLLQLARVPYDFTIRSVIQKSARGLGDAILHAEKFIGGEDFAVFLPDDLIFAKKPVIGQMIDVYNRYKKPVLAVERVERDKISSYGIIKPETISSRIFNVTDMAEKPALKDAFSNLGIVGRYILPAAIFGLIKNTGAGAIGEIQLTDALRQLVKTTGLLAYRFDGLRCDTGDKHAYMLAILRYAGMQKELTKKFKKEIKKIFKL